MIITIRELQEKTYEIINMALREDEPIKIGVNGEYLTITKDVHQAETKGDK